MKFQTVAALSLASVVLADKAEVMNGVYDDIENHLEDYLKIIDEIPSDLLSLFKKAQTYTDDSYTTLYNQVDLNEVSTFATGLSWYSSRLATYFAEPATSTTAPESSATTEATSSTTEAEESSEVESSTTEAEKSSSAVTSAPYSNSSITSESSSSASSQAEVSSTSVQIVDEENAANGNIAYMLAPFLLALGVPSLL